MKSFKLSEKIKEAWNLYKNNFVVFFLWFACYFLIKSIAMKGVILLPILSLVLWILVSYMIVRFILYTLDNKKFDPFSKSFLPTFKEVWNFIKTFIMLYIVTFSILAVIIAPVFIHQSLFMATISSIIYLIVTIIVALVFSVFVSVRLGFACLISIDENIGFIKSFKKSWKITKNKFWYVLWNYFLVCCVFIFSSIIFSTIFSMIIGLLGQVVLMAFVVPISLILIILLYRSLIDHHKNINEPKEVEEDKKEDIAEESKEEIQNEPERVIKDAEIINE